MPSARSPAVAARLLEDWETSLRTLREGDADTTIGVCWTSRLHSPRELAEVS